MGTVTDLPPTQYLILEVLAARYRTGEPFWTFPTSLRPALAALVDSDLVDVISSPKPGALRVRLTEHGLGAALSLNYQLPTPTLAAAIDTLPTEDEQYWAWMRRHGLGHGAGIATVISAVRNDLRRLSSGSRLTEGGDVR